MCEINEALKSKRLWRFAKDEHALWRKVIASKYGVDNSRWWCKKSPNAHGVGCWKSILKGLELFKTLVRFKVKNGSNVLFWQDVWCAVSSLKTQFPNLFRLARFKDAMVQ